MANTRIKRSEVDRWTGNAITNVSKNTPAQQKVVDEWNAHQGGSKKRPSTAKKK